MNRREMLKRVTASVAVGVASVIPVEKQATSEPRIVNDMANSEPGKYVEVSFNGTTYKVLHDGTV